MQTPVKSPAGEIRQTFWTRSPSPSRPNVTSGQSPSVTPRKSFWTRSPSPTRPPVTEQTLPGLPMTPKKSFWKGASSPTTTPKRRPKDELSLPNKKAQRIVDSFSNFQESVKNVQAFTRSDNDNAIAAKCIAKYGLDVFLVASNAVKHVPVMFLDRMKYISNIIREVNSQISDSEILDLVDAVSCIKFDMCVGEKSFKDVLWRASFKHGEPYMNFLVPHVAHCIASECGGNIYPAYISNVTLYKLTGPEPGLKCIMRCRTCSTRYNIDFYTIPNLGRKLYAGNQKPGLKSSSTWSYFSQDTFELMCESGNHAFVSHKAFADIYNGVFNEERDHEFYKWQNLYTSKPGYGSSGDAIIFNASEFLEMVQDGAIRFPDKQPFPNDTVDMPFFLVGDDALCLTENVQKPYGHRALTREERILNYLLSRARRVSENDKQTGRQTDRYSFDTGA